MACKNHLVLHRNLLTRIRVSATVGFISRSAENFHACEMRTRTVALIGLKQSRMHGASLATITNIVSVRFLMVMEMRGSLSIARLDRNLLVHLRGADGRSRLRLMVRSLRLRRDYVHRVGSRAVQAANFSTAIIKESGVRRINFQCSKKEVGTDIHLEFWTRSIRNRKLHIPSQRQTDLRTHLVQSDR